MNLPMPLSSIVAILPSRQSAVAVVLPDGTIESVHRVVTHAQRMVDFLAAHVGLTVIQAPRWQLDGLESQQDLGVLHGTAETAIRWYAAAEIVGRPVQLVKRMDWLSDITRRGICKRSDDNRVRFLDTALRIAPDLDMKFAEVICFATWAKAQTWQQPKLPAFAITAQVG